MVEGTNGGMGEEGDGGSECGVMESSVDDFL